MKKGRGMEEREREREESASHLSPLLRGCRRYFGFESVFFKFQHIKRVVFSHGAVPPDSLDSE